MAHSLSSDSKDGSGIKVFIIFNKPKSLIGRILFCQHICLTKQLRVRVLRSPHMAAWPEKIQHYKRKQQQKHRAVTHYKLIAAQVISSVLYYVQCIH